MRRLNFTDSRDRGTEPLRSIGMIWDILLARTDLGRSLLDGSMLRSSTQSGQLL